MSAPLHYKTGDFVVLAGPDGRHYLGAVTQVTGKGKQYVVRIPDGEAQLSADDAQQLMRPVISREVAEQSLAALRSAPPTTLDGLVELLDRAANSLSHEARRDALRHIYGLATIDDRGLADSQLVLEQIIFEELSLVLGLEGSALEGEMRSRYPAQSAFRARFAAQFHKEPVIPITRFEPK